MMSLPFWLSFGAGSVLLVPSSVYFTECLSAVLSGSPGAPPLGRRPRLCVLVPAHNEASGIGPTVEGLHRQLVQGDRLWVIADNCSDNTAEVARQAGATVLERFNERERGKGYAISFGLEQLDADPPEVVVLVDADCTLSDNALDTLSRLALAQQRPVQGEYLLTAPDSATPRSSISALALIVRNRVRPLGLLRFGWPCHLTGTGMAFPWELIRHTPALGDNLVEDLVMGLDMAVAGHPPLFCPSVKVRSALPESDQGATSQRTRWEHGQLATLLDRGPKLLAAGLRQRRPELVVLALDLMVPPLALLTTALAASTGVSGLVGLALKKPLLTMLPSLAGLALVGSGTTAAWARFAKDAVPMRTLAMAPVYVAWKIPMYVSLAVKGKQKSWVRTERSSTETAESAGAHSTSRGNGAPSGASAPNSLG